MCCTIQSGKSPPVTYLENVMQQYSTFYLGERSYEFFLTIN